MTRPGPKVWATVAGLGTVIVYLAIPAGEMPDHFVYTFGAGCPEHTPLEVEWRADPTAPWAALPQVDIGTDVIKGDGDVPETAEMRYRAEGGDWSCVIPVPEPDLSLGLVAGMIACAGLRRLRSQRVTGPPSRV